MPEWNHHSQVVEAATTLLLVTWEKVQISCLPFMVLVGGSCHAAVEE